MAKPRVTATDRLANVIEVVELGQRTGLLAVERGSGSVLEEGALYFVSGRVISASLAGLRGREALAALSRWGPCRFSFDRDAPQPVPNVPLGDPTPRAHGGSRPDFGVSTPGYRTPVAPESSGIWPSQSPPSRTSGMLDLPPGAYSHPSSANGYHNGSNTAGANGHSQTGALGYGTPSGYSLQHRGSVPAGPSSTSSLSGSGSGSASLLYRRPRRAPDVRDLMAVVTSHSLTRSHRTVLLLADGEHTVLDLARLSSKSVDEVSALLSDLEARNLVYYYQ